MKIDENGIKWYTFQEEQALKKQGVYDYNKHHVIGQISTRNYAKYVKDYNRDMVMKKVLGFCLGFFIGFAPIVSLMFCISIPLLIMKWMVKGFMWLLTGGSY